MPNDEGERARRWRPRSARRGTAAAAERVVGARLAQSRNAPSSRTPSDQRAQRPGAEPQPSSLPRTIPQTPRNPRRRAARAGEVERAAARPCDSGSAQSSSGTATTATGTLSQKIACQRMPSTTAPPMTGPSATPRPETPPQMPIAIARRAAGTAAASRVRDSGMIAAAPTPWTARAAISGSALVAEGRGDRGEREHGDARRRTPGGGRPVAEGRGGEHEGREAAACRRSRTTAAARRWRPGRRGCTGQRAGHDEVVEGRHEHRQRRGDERDGGAPAPPLRAVARRGTGLVPAA